LEPVLEVDRRGWSGTTQVDILAMEREARYVHPFGIMLPQRAGGRLSQRHRRRGMGADRAGPRAAPRARPAPDARRPRDLQRDPVRGERRHPVADAPRDLPALAHRVDGLITTDRFCLTRVREGALKLRRERTY